MLIGSRALALHDKSFRVKPDADWDIIGYAIDEIGWRRGLRVPDGGRIEFHDPEHLNNADMLAYGDGGVCSLSGLAIIKRSHLWRDWFFDKHIVMYHRHLAGVVLSDSDRFTLKERTKITKKAYPQGNPNLNQSNEDFFDDSVAKIYEHDYIHELYAYYDRPLFERLKHEGGEDSAWCAKDLWSELNHDDKNKCVAEETYVIATERFMVRNDWNYHPRRAYDQALKKVCTTLCSGWFRDHAIDNHPDITNLFDKSKFDTVKAKLAMLP